MIFGGMIIAGFFVIAFVCATGDTFSPFVFCFFSIFGYIVGGSFAGIQGSGDKVKGFIYGMSAGLIGTSLFPIILNYTTYHVLGEPSDIFYPSFIIYAIIPGMVGAMVFGIIGSTLSRGPIIKIKSR